MFLCRPYKSGLNRRRNRLVSHACSFSPLKSHHILTLSNMIKTIMHFSMGSILLPCNLRLAVDLWIWICLLGFIPLTVLNLRGQRTCESALSQKTIDCNSVHNCSPIRISLAESQLQRDCVTCRTVTTAQICFTDFVIHDETYVASASTCHLRFSV